MWLGPIVFKLLRGSNLAISGLHLLLSDDGLLLSRFCLSICGAGLFECRPGLRDGSEEEPNHGA
jgi:hypothetical protein